MTTPFQPDPKQKARFVPDSGQALQVHFNPSTLQVTLANTLDKKQGKAPKQFVKDSSATLSVEVVFDSTDTGANVCSTTAQLAAMMAPTSQQTPPNVTFTWGLFSFKGIIASYKETIDFFSTDGVPLRSTVQLTMSRLENVFPASSGPSDPAATPADQQPVDVPVAGQSISNIAGQAGDPSAASSVAAANGEENMRFPTGSTITVDPSVVLGPPVGFAGAGAGLGGGAAFAAGFGAGVGFGASAGFGAGASAGFGAGASAGFGAGASAGFGAGASAGFGAGASAGFGAGASAGFGAGASGFGVSGGAGVSAGASFGASAGVSAGAGVSFGTGASVGAGFASSGGVSFASAGGISGVAVGGSGGVAAGAFAAFGSQPVRAAGSIGASASAGVPASQGAFAFLRVPPDTTSVVRALQTATFTSQTAPYGYTTTGDAMFDVGGRALVQGSTGLTTTTANVEFEGA